MIKKCLRCKRKRRIHARGLCQSCYNFLRVKDKKLTKKQKANKSKIFKKWYKKPKNKGKQRIAVRIHMRKKHGCKPKIIDGEEEYLKTRNPQINKRIKNKGKKLTDYKKIKKRK